MKKINLKHLLLLLLFVSKGITGQTVLSIDTDLRFKGKIKGEFYTDKSGLLQDFTLGLEWWTLLGEPIEIYSILWNSTNSYKIEVSGEEKTITKNMVSKYPDLLKRFNSLRPYKLDLENYGNANGKTSSVKRGAILANSEFYNQGFAYKKKGQSYDPQLGIVEYRIN